MAGYLGQQFSFRIFPNLWVDVSNYSRWMGQIKDTAGIPALILGLVGIFLFEAGQSRKWMLGLWLGYAIYGFTFAYHIGTHDYYQLPLIPILALSIAPLGSMVISRILSIHTRKYIRPMLYGLSMVIVLTLLWQNRNILNSEDYRAEPGVLAVPGRQTEGRVCDRVDRGLRLPHGILRMGQHRQLAGDWRPGCTKIGR